MAIHFSLSTLKAPGTPGTSGGMISNYRLMEAISSLAEMSITSVSGLSGVLRSSEELLELASRGDPAQAAQTSAASRHYRLQATLARELEAAIDAIGLGPIVAAPPTISTAARVAAKHGVELIPICRHQRDLDFALPVRPRGLGLRQTLVATVYGRSTRQAVHRSKLLLTNSQFMSRWLSAEFGPEVSIQVIYPPIDLPRLPVRLGGIETIGFNARGSNKGIGFAIELARRLPAIEFLFCGQVQGSLYGKLPANCRQVGYVTDREALFGSIDAVVVPSSGAEPYGRMGPEALMSGIPAFVANVGGLPEAVGLQDFIIESADPDVWATRIRQFAGVDSDLPARVSAAQDLVETQAGMRSHKRRVQEVFAQWV